jgi:hypothetical protein
MSVIWNPGTRHDLDAARAPVDNFRHVSEGGDMISNMSSDREALIEALETIEAGYRGVAVFPFATLSRTEGQALLARLDKLDQQLVALQRRLSGQLITMARSA